eukprot:852328-Pleurochrysis_carterae.AAC.1
MERAKRRRARHNRLIARVSVKPAGKASKLSHMCMRQELCFFYASMARQARARSRASMCSRANAMDLSTNAQARGQKASERAKITAVERGGDKIERGGSAGVETAHGQRVDACLFVPWWIEWGRRKHGQAEERAEERECERGRTRERGELSEGGRKREERGKRRGGDEAETEGEGESDRERGQGGSTEEVKANDGGKREENGERSDGTDRRQLGIKGKDRLGRGIDARYRAEHAGSQLPSTPLAVNEMGNGRENLHVKEREGMLSHARDKRRQESLHTGLRNLFTMHTDASRDS